MKPIYPWWFRRLCQVARLFFDKLEVRGHEELRQPCVFVMRHMDCYGPFAAYLYVPVEFHLWTYYPFLEPEAFVRQAVDFTFTKRIGMPRFMANLCAQLLKYPLTWAYRAVGMLPVYRGTRKILKSMELTVDCLEKGESVLIFPDVDYAETEREVGEIYTGFIRLGKMYHDKTGKALSFQPISVSSEEKSMRFGVPIAYDPAQPVQKERERIAEHLCKEMQTH